MDSTATDPAASFDSDGSSQHESEAKCSLAAPSQPNPMNNDSFTDDRQEEDVDDDDDFDFGSSNKNNRPKKFGGYTYWKRDVPETDLVVLKPPTQITSPVLQSVATSGNGPSQWNRTGITWEERDVTNKVKALLHESLSSGTAVPTLDSLPGLALQLCAPHVSECECSICFVRGKPRFGFDIQATANWLFYVGKDLLLEGTVVARDWTDHSEATLDARVSSKSFVEDIEKSYDNDDEPESPKNADSTTSARLASSRDGHEIEQLWREYRDRIERLLHHALSSSIQQIRDTLVGELNLQPACGPESIPHAT